MLNQQSGNNSINNQGNGNSINQSIYQGGANLASLTPEELRKEEILAEQVISSEKKSRYKKFIFALAIFSVCIILTIIIYLYFKNEISIKDLITAFAPSMLQWALPLLFFPVFAFISGGWGWENISKRTEVEEASYAQIKEVNKLYKRKGLSNKDIKILKKIK